MSGLLPDLRFALRRSRKSPGFTLTAILTLAFGLGATTAIFSIVESVLLRPLPFADPNRLVALGNTTERSLWSGDLLVSGPEIPAYERDTHGFSSVGAYQQTRFELSGTGDPAAQEMAIHLALGSQRSGVMRLVLASGAKLGVLGCGIGILTAVFATRLLCSLLFQVDPLDPIVLVLATIAVFLLGLAASVLPARRAAKVDPIVALRYE
jgi:hypothetical protein